MERLPVGGKRYSESFPLGAYTTHPLGDAAVVAGVVVAECELELLRWQPAVSAVAAKTRPIGDGSAALGDAVAVCGDVSCLGVLSDLRAGRVEGGPIVVGDRRGHGVQVAVHIGIGVCPGLERRCAGGWPGLGSCVAE